MDSQHLEQLVARLKELDSQSVLFYDAKQTLLSEGYSEEEITNATYTFPYDGKPNQALSQSHLVGAAIDVSSEIKPYTDSYGRPSAKASAESASSGGKLTLLNYVILRLIVALSVVGNILTFMLRPYPWPHQAYMVEYWLAGVTVGVLLLTMATRSLTLTWKNGMSIGLGLIAAAGLFINARYDEYMLKTYSSEKCMQMLRNATAESEATGALPPPNLGLPAGCLERTHSDGQYR